jgi:LPXTG-motif cell wall-anchored protein
VAPSPSPTTSAGLSPATGSLAPDTGGSSGPSLPIAALLACAVVLGGILVVARRGRGRLG